jgi:hypothetical protein
MTWQAIFASPCDMGSGKTKLVVVDVRLKDEQDVSMIKGALRKDDFEKRKADFKVGCGGGLLRLPRHASRC